jgi:hypothetical protein
MSRERTIQESAEPPADENISRKTAFTRASPYLILVLLGLILSWPVLVHGFPDLSNDGFDHARLNGNFAAQFWSGELYPRWLSGVNGGFGSAAYYLYPPLQGFVASLFWPLARGWDPYGWFIAGYACVLATVFAGVTAFIWLRTFAGPASALFGAAVYMIAPYHLAIDVYNRGAAAEYWIFVWLPLLMLAAQGIASNSGYSTAGLAGSYALCVYSHATVAACSAALPLAYVLTFSEPKRRWRATLASVFGLMLGVGLAAVFLLPAVLDQSKTWASLQTEGWGEYRNWWLFSIRDQITETGTQGTGIPWYFSYKMRILVITIWTVIFSGTSYWLTRRYSTSGMARRLAAFYLGTTVAAFFLMLRQSAIVWRVIPVLPLLQFPFRLSTFLVMAAAALSCLAFGSLKQKGARYGAAAIMLSLLGWIAADAVFARQAYSVWRYVPPERAAQNAGLLRTQKEHYAFWPKAARVIDLSTVAALEKFIAAHPPKQAHLTGEAAAGSALVESWKPRKVLLKVDAPAGGQLILNHFYMEGWRARIEGSPTDLTLNPSRPDGLIVVNVPAGVFNLIVDLPPDRAERTGKLISLASLATLAAMLIGSKLSAVGQDGILRGVGNPAASLQGPPRL